MSKLSPNMISALKKLADGPALRGWAVPGTTQEALERRGLVTLRWLSHGSSPKGSVTAAELTDAGRAVLNDILAAEQPAAPVETPTEPMPELSAAQIKTLIVLAAPGVYAGWSKMSNGNFYGANGWPVSGAPAARVGTLDALFNRGLISRQINNNWNTYTITDAGRALLNEIDDAETAPAEPTPAADHDTAIMASLFVPAGMNEDQHMAETARLFPGDGESDYRQLQTGDSWADDYDDDPPTNCPDCGYFLNDAGECRSCGYGRNAWDDPFFEGIQDAREWELPVGPADDLDEYGDPDYPAESPRGGLWVDITDQVSPAFTESIVLELAAVGLAYLNSLRDQLRARKQAAADTTGAERAIHQNAIHELRDQMATVHRALGLSDRLRRERAARRDPLMQPFFAYVTGPTMGLGGYDEPHERRTAAGAWLARQWCDEMRAARGIAREFQYARHTDESQDGWNQAAHYHRAALDLYLGASDQFRAARQLNHERQMLRHMARRFHVPTIHTRRGEILDGGLPF